MNTTEKPSVQPFTVAVPDADLADLQARLDRTRLARPAPGDAWEYGTPVAYLRQAVEAWRASSTGAPSRPGSTPSPTS